MSPQKGLELSLKPGLIEKMHNLLTVSTNIIKTSSVLTMDNKTNVWVVEDKTEFRQTLEYLLNHSIGTFCGGVFSSCEKVIEKLDEGLKKANGFLFPEVILLDINLPDGMTGLDGLIEIKSRSPKTNIVMLTIRDDASSIFQALKNGASGYLSKDASVNEIIDAIDEADRGGMPMTPPVAKQVLNFFTHDERPPNDYGLSERESEVLNEMSNGFVQKEIAHRLYLSRHTVDSHVRKIYAKLHVRNGIEAVAKALREGLID